MNGPMQRVKHLAWLVQVAALVAAGAALLLGGALGEGFREEPWIVLCGLVWAGAYALGGAHESSLCCYCFEEFPADAQAAAARHGRWMLLHHLGSTRPLYPMMVIHVACALMARLGVPGARIGGLVCIAVTFWGVAVWVVATRRHDLLQLWCPWCGGHGEGGGGGDEGDGGEPDGPCHGRDAPVPVGEADSRQASLVRVLSG